MSKNSFTNSNLSPLPRASARIVVEGPCLLCCFFLFSFFQPCCNSFCDERSFFPDCFRKMIFRRKLCHFFLLRFIRNKVSKYWTKLKLISYTILYILNFIPCCSKWFNMHGSCYKMSCFFSKVRTLLKLEVRLIRSIA